MHLPWALPTLFVSLFVLGGCKSTPSSQVQDIYEADEGDHRLGNPRRRPATIAETRLVVSAQGCSGFLLSPRFLMTAEHCDVRVNDTFTSGAALSVGRANDIIVEQVVEQSVGLDYVIAKIKWKWGYPKEQWHVQRLAIRASDVVASPTPGQGDHVYTVGFPADKKAWVATYSRGQIKKIEGSYLLYNVGTINGNSGGPLLRATDHLLIATTTGGPREYLAPGWNRNSLDDEEAWNAGPAIWAIHAYSTILKQLFPNGVYSPGAEAELLRAPGTPTAEPAVLPRPQEGVTSESLISYYDSNMALAPPTRAAPRRPWDAQAVRTPVECRDVGMLTYMRFQDDFMTNLHLSTYFDPKPCRMAGKSMRTAIYAMEVRGTDTCGVRRYQGRSREHTTMTFVDEGHGGPVMYGPTYELATGKARYGAPDLGAKRLPPSTVTVEDHRFNHCTAKAPTTWVITETFQDGWGVKLFGNSPHKP